MKISYNWLKNYLAIDIVPEEVAHTLTFCGLEVESIEKYESIKGGLNGIVIGEVITKEKHPDADKLSVTTVNVGTENLLHIVCGAPNVAAGQKVLVATIGAMLYPITGEPFEIKKSKIRGAVSEGMICAEDEIGLGLSHEGILVLPPDVKVGTAAADYFKIENDIVFEIGLTPNRIDAASHIGVARDLAAVLTFNQKKSWAITKPAITDLKPNNSPLNIEVEVQDNNACARYSGVVIDGIRVGESPVWLKNRLSSIGLKPINNVVDITNFVLHETGQPLHAFDVSAIKGNKVIVKKLPADQKFITLDGIERTITPNDLMICNELEPMCIAGVYGGLKSGVSESTTSVFLESACFNASSIRRTAKHHNLKTDASFRFERGTDPEITVYALQRAANLIMEIAGGEIASPTIDIYPVKAIPSRVNLSYSRCAILIGKELEKEEIKSILTSLEIKILSESDNDLVLEIPPFKVDVTREADVIEEILRIYGYNNVEIPLQMKMALVPKNKIDTEHIHQTIAETLIGVGFNEIWNNSLTASSFVEKLLPDEFPQMVKIKNPLSTELNAMRQTMLFGMLQTISYNQRRRNSDLKLYELGKTYHQIGERFIEKNKLAIAICGKQNEEHWSQATIDETFYRLTGIVTLVLQRLGLNKYTTNVQKLELFQSGLAYILNTKNIVEASSVKTSVLKQFDIATPVFYAEFCLDDMYQAISKHKITYVEVPKFQEVRRDLALLLDKEITFAQVKQLAFNTEKKLLKKVSLFDVYDGKNIAQDKKSYAISFLLQDDSATLNDEQIDKTMEKLIQVYQKELGASLRA